MGCKVLAGAERCLLSFSLHQGCDPHVRELGTLSLVSTLTHRHFNQGVCKIDKLKGPKKCESSLLTHNAHVTIFCQQLNNFFFFASSRHLLSTHMVDLWLLDCERDCVFGLRPPERNS